MIGALIILLITVAVGIVLYVYDLKWRKEHAEEGSESSENLLNKNDEQPEHGEICCGRHLICEKSLVPEPGEKPVYYDDEELDRFAGREENQYTAQEVEEIRDIMLTLLPEDVPGWVRSMQLRGINFPTELRDELIIMLRDGT